MEQPTVIHEDLQYLQRLLALRLAEGYSLAGKDALAQAAILVSALQEVAGGDRLGSRGMYIPVPKNGQRRDERIREMMGPPPHSRRRVQEVAEAERCHVSTVWRALEGSRETSEG